ncbi:YbaB/EbfC family nucleoid-associated protein [Pseudonocardia sp. KRD291]|uniref:YbaB/EbfC family nucleoid-associated protein n=1 Tax=Pseudonocardia sp. KRD291 TaxID=2792007 RepID=UPI001C49E073|nr:YbaB/EbfC family nucleoid-associated protein [Pseudonocardia sp. KRD291]MBW0104786.1 YbaB/EbfC family nucleoid-associated protein [Pseudonocardia sp. KRD291]
MDPRPSRHLTGLPSAPSSSGADPSDTRAWLADYRGRMEELRGRAERAQAQLEGLTATAASRDGAVTVTVNGSGALLELRFGSRAEDVPRNRLAELVLSLSREAAADASRQVREVVEPVTAAGRAAR